MNSTQQNQSQPQQQIQLTSDQTVSDLPNQQPQRPMSPTTIKPQQTIYENNNENDQLKLQEADLEKYFSKAFAQRSKSVRKQSQMNQVIVKQGILSAIKTGIIELDANPACIDNLLSPVSQQLADESKTKKMMIQMQLQYLYKQINKGKSKSKQSDEELMNSLLVLSKDQHREFMDKMLKDRKESSRRKELWERNMRKIQEEEILRQADERERKEKQKSDRRQKIAEKLKASEEEAQKRANLREESNKELLKVKKKKRTYQILSDKYNSQVVLPALEERKEKLKSMREMNQMFNVPNIKAHQREYLLKREQSLSSSQAKRDKQDWEYKKPEKLERLAKVLEQQDRQAKLNLEYNKKKIQQKLWRQQEFAKYLKKMREPKIDPQKRQQIEKRLHSEQQRYRNQHQSTSTRKLGLNYLESVRKMPKKPRNSHSSFTSQMTSVENDRQISTERTCPEYLNKHRMKKNGEMRQKKIESIINSQSDRFTKISQLQLESQKLLEEQRQLEFKSKFSKGRSKDEDAVENIRLLLTSIKTRIGIINAYNND